MVPKREVPQTKPNQHNNTDHIDGLHWVAQLRVLTDNAEYWAGPESSDSICSTLPSSSLNPSLNLNSGILDPRDLFPSTRVAPSATPNPAQSVCVKQVGHGSCKDNTSPKAPQRPNKFKCPIDGCPNDYKERGKLGRHLRKVHGVRRCDGLSDRKAFRASDGTLLLPCSKDPAVQLYTMEGRSNSLQ